MKIILRKRNFNGEKLMIVIGTFDERTLTLRTRGLISFGQVTDCEI